MSVEWRVDRSQLREPFATDVDGLLADDPGDWVVTCGRRDNAEQARLYLAYLDGGPKAAPPGESAHEEGLAVDVTLRQGKSDDWDYTDPDWHRMINAVHDHPRLHSLASIGDGDHIEAYKWRTLL